MRFIVYVIFFSFVSHYGFTQQLGSSSWETLDEFKAEEPNIIQNIIWLENNPIATEQNDTKALSENIINWLSNTPYISVVLDGVFLERIMDNKKFKYAEKFKVTYLFGKSLYIIENQDNLDEAKASVRGIEGMITVYNEIKMLDPSLNNAVLEKYVRLRKKEKLESFVRDRLAQSNSILSF